MASNVSTSCPSVCPVNYSSNWSTPSPFWANNWSNNSFPWSNTFGANFPSTNAFGGNVPAFGANFPSTYGNFPAFAGNFPSTYGNFPAFAGNFPSTQPWANNWNFPSTFAGEHSWNRHALPCEYRDVPSRPMSVIEYWSLQNPIYIHPVDGSRMLHVCFDVKGFKPEEVKVEINSKERSINIECKHESKSEKEHQVVRSFTRKFVLPEYYSVDLSKCEIKCHVTADGLLIVESVLPRLSVEELKNLKEKVPATKSAQFHGDYKYACGPTVSIPLKVVA